MDLNDLDNDKSLRIYFDTSFQGVKRLFVLASDVLIEIKSININKLEKVQQDKEIITQQDVC